jgi:GDP-L-fucose synthase
VSDLLGLERQTVLVTGGHGFIGRHIVAALSRAGADPISISQQPNTSPSLPGESIVLDLEDRDGVVEAVKRADYVVHLAARAGGIQFQQDIGGEVFSSNRLITDNVLAACDQASPRRLFLASSLVTYRPAAEPLSESHPQLGPDDSPDPYAWSKITDEVAARWHRDVDVVVGRFGNVYGPGASFDPDRSTVVHALIDRAAHLKDSEDLMVWGDGRAIRSFVFVEDAAEAVLITLVRGAAGSAYNIDDKNEVTIANLATTVRDLVNPTLRLSFDTTKPAGDSYRVASIARLAALGYSPKVELKEGLRRTVDWYLSSVPA